jgi:hypothetical protein
MNFRLAILTCLVLSLESAASAQRSQNRIDLSVDEATLPDISAWPPADSGIGFRPTEVACPEEHGTVQIRAGQIFLFRINSQNRARSSTLPGNGIGRLFHAKPLDDESYQYEIGNEACRLVLHVRLQTQRNGEWQPVFLPYWSRPSVSKEERARELRKFLNEERERGKIESKTRPLPPSSQLLGDVGGTGEAFFFEGPPEARLADCFQAVGTYEVSQEGVFFTFLRALPGNLNRFAIERNDINNYQGRLNFVHSGCRLQITTSGYWKYHSEWAPLTLERPI